MRRIEGVLRDTGGDLGAAAAALVALDAAWQPQTKLRTPLDYVVAALRALDVPPTVAGLAGSLAGTRPAALDRAAAERLARPRGRLGRTRGDDAAHRLGLRVSPAVSATAIRPSSPKPASARCSGPTLGRRCVAPARAATR